MNKNKKPDRRLEASSVAAIADDHHFEGDEIGRQNQEGFKPEEIETLDHKGKRSRCNVPEHLPG